MSDVITKVGNAIWPACPNGPDAAAKAAIAALADNVTEAMVDAFGYGGASQRESVKNCLVQSLRSLLKET